MGNAFREPGARPTTPVCEQCGTPTDQGALQFGPDGRQLCRRCFGHLQSAQADRRAQMSPGSSAVGQFANRNPAVFIRLVIMACVGGFFFLMFAVAAAGVAGEKLRDCVGR